VENTPNDPQTAIGAANMARKDFWSILNDISMYSLRIEEDGMREPHWYPFTAEMGYVHKGNARMSVMDPDGSVDTYTLKPGDVISFHMLSRIKLRLLVTRRYIS
jgi:oxalate decarboxylase